MFEESNIFVKSDCRLVDPSSIFENICIYNMAITQEQQNDCSCYYVGKCPRCEALKLKIEICKQMLSKKNKAYSSKAKTSVWMRKDEVLTLKEAKSFKICCYECEENEETLKWYQCLYKMS